LDILTNFVILSKKWRGLPLKNRQFTQHGILRGKIRFFKKIENILCFSPTLWEDLSGKQIDIFSINNEGTMNNEKVKEPPRSGRREPSLR